MGKGGVMGKLQDIAFYGMKELADEYADKLREITDMLAKEDKRLFAKAVDILGDKK